MKKSEKLAQLIHMPVEIVEREIDKGMWDILIELNKKNYFTQFSCEGHIIENNGNYPNGYWQGYLVFRGVYKFPQYPVRYSKANRKRDTFYWEGIGEKSRQEFLANVLTWAKCLPTRPIEKVIWYTLSAKNKNRPNGDYKVLAHTTDYEEVKCLLAGANMDKYIDVNLYETEV